MTADQALLELCLERLSTLIDRPQAEIEPESSFASLGLDSAMAVHFVLEIEDATGVELYPEVTADYPTLQGFADYVASLRPQ